MEVTFNLSRGNGDRHSESRILDGPLRDDALWVLFCSSWIQISSIKYMRVSYEIRVFRRTIAVFLKVASSAIIF